MITKQEFDKLTSGEVFATGIQPNSPEGIFMTRDGGNLRWVAVKGFANDWTCYCHWEDKSFEWIKQHGDKLHNENHIQLCVPCEDEVLKRYRY